jgi:hypothetical protein
MNLSSLHNVPHDIIGVILSYVVDAKCISSYFSTVTKYCKKNKNREFALWFFMLYKNNYCVPSRDISDKTNTTVMKYFNGKDYADIFSHEVYFADMTRKLVLDGILALNYEIFCFYRDYIKKHHALKKKVDDYIIANINVIKETVSGLLMLEKYGMCNLKEKDYYCILQPPPIFIIVDNFFSVKECRRIICTKISTSILILQNLLLQSEEELFETLEFLVKLKKIDFASEIYLLLSTKFSDDDDLYSKLLCFFVENVERNYNSRHFVISQLNKKKVSCSSICAGLEKKEIADPDEFETHDVRVFMDYIHEDVFNNHSSNYFDIKTNNREESCSKIKWSEYYYSTGELLETDEDVLLIPKNFWKYKKVSRHEQQYSEHTKYKDIEYTFLSKAEKNRHRNDTDKTDELLRTIGPLEIFDRCHTDRVLLYNDDLSYDQYSDSSYDDRHDDRYDDSDDDYMSDSMTDESYYGQQSHCNYY